MKKLFLILLYFLVIPASASHIVGGEFEMLYIGQFPGDFRYKISMFMYFDEVHGAQANKRQDAIIYARIYRVSDDAIMVDKLAISLSDSAVVNYTQPNCAISEIRTSKLIYTTTVTLPGTQYNDPKGYYIAWERCCRNYSIVNIFSNDPNAPGAVPAGQTFYLKFPPVVKNGIPFINSSPSLTTLLSDYACPSKSYYENFAGIDSDGDSIAYSIVTPLSTHSSGNPIPTLPQPYPLITWRSPFNFSNIMGGNPDLKIDKNGFIRVTPGFITGLFVFAVKYEEYRKGQKIGETRRDFQLYVSGNSINCPDAEPPQVRGRKLNESTYSKVHEPLYVDFPKKVSDADRCVEIQVYDPDSQKATQSFQEIIVVKVIPLNFKGDISALLPGATATLTKHDSVKTFKICFDRCPYIEGPFQIGIIASDDACALPLTDTLKLTVNIKPPLNQNAKFHTPNVTETVDEGSGTKAWKICGYDLDGDALTATVVPIGFDMAKVGMTIDPPVVSGDSLKTVLHWDTDCHKFDFTKQTEFKIKISLEDKDSCSFSHPALMIFNLILDDHNSPPDISSSLDILETKTSHKFDSVTFSVFEKPSLTFKVAGHDDDKDVIVLKGSARDFKLSDYRIEPLNVQKGPGDVFSNFTWPINCDNVKLNVKNKFDFRFIVVDSLNRCHIHKADTLDVNVTIKPAINTKPQLTVASLQSDSPLVNNTLSAVMGQPINLDLKAFDTDNNPADFLKMELLKDTDNPIPIGYVFKPNNGNGHADAVFSWLPSCSIFKNGVYENNYNLSFRVTDNRCNSVKGDTVQVNLIVKDMDYGAKEFLPPNFITPNGDGLNEYFAMEGIDVPGNSELIIDPNEVISLPKENCARRFENIRIYNRWGKEVFNSSQRNFRWYAQDAVVGVYFYTLKFTNKEYKGTISVRQ